MALRLKCLAYADVPRMAPLPHTVVDSNIDVIFRRHCEALASAATRSRAREIEIGESGCHLARANKGNRTETPPDFTTVLHLPDQHSAVSIPAHRVTSHIGGVSKGADGKNTPDLIAEAVMERYMLRSEYITAPFTRMRRESRNHEPPAGR